jgi:hypothetical protein
VLDGRIIEVVGDVNSVGRKAFRRLKNKSLVEDFKYHVIKGRSSETALDPTTPENPPPVA